VESNFGNNQLIYQIEDYQITEIRTGYVEKMFEKYIPQNSLVVADGKNINGILIPPNITNIVFDDCTNPVDVERHLKQIGLDRDYTVLSGLYKYHRSITPDPKIKFFPFWAIWSSLQEDTPTDPLRKYKISCLNGSPWNHRKLVYLYLSQKDYFKEIIFTFGHRLVQYPNTFSDFTLNYEEALAFSKLEQQVEFVESDATIGIDVSINHPAYLDSYINLVTETDTRSSTPMLSEKTFKPILARQLFILIASPGAIQFLRDIGLDTFDDVIDHSYDNILDPKIRIKQVIDQLDQLAQVDLVSIYRKLYHRLDDNAKYLRSERFRKQFWLN